MILPGFPSFSKSNVLGPELIVNGDFSSGTGWNTGPGWSISSGTATGVTADSQLTQTSPVLLTANMVVRVTFTIASNSGSGIVSAFAAGAAFGLFTANGTHTVDCALPTAASQQIGVVTEGGFSGSVVVDDISVKLFG